MTRIFDALRKAQSPRGRAATPAPPAIVPVPSAGPRSPRPVTERPYERADERRPAIVPFTAAVDVPADVAHEMTALRVSLEVALTERVPRVVMMLAPQGGEGTSTLAAQFALTLAADPRTRVLLVDAHARRPAYAPNGVPTARRARAGDRSASDGAGARNLGLMPLTEASRTERLMNPAALRDTLEAVAGDHDWIVIDGPPALESPDAAPLGAVADGIVVVVQAGRTKRPVLTRSVDLLRRAGGRVLGTVLNRRRLEIPGFIYRRI